MTEIMSIQYFRKPVIQLPPGRVLRDFLLGSSGVLLMHLTLQLVLYPELNFRFGENGYGEILFLISVMSIFSVSFGTAVDNARLVLRHDAPPGNGDCNWILLLSGIIALAGGLPFAVGHLNETGVFSFALLALMMMLRYYSAVEYRMKIEYVRYFFFFAVLAAGYLLGAYLLRVGLNWCGAFLIGEIAALLFAFRFGTIYRPPFFRTTKYFRRMFRTSVLLSGAEFFYNVIQNLDRLLLIYLLNPAANTQYYVISLIGRSPALLVQPLNSICISYLSTPSRRLSSEKFFRLSCGMIGLGICCFIGCFLMTPPFLRLFYPDQADAGNWLIGVICLGQIFCFLGNILMVILLTQIASHWQLILQSSYALVFLGLAIPWTIRHGISGFSWAVLTANAVRVLAAVGLGVFRTQTERQRIRKSKCKFGGEDHEDR